jgi:alpha-galactosidase
MHSGISFEGDQLPFSFVYDGTPSASLLLGWERDITYEDEQRTVRFRDEVSGLQASARVRTLSGGATEWVVEFANTGTERTPLIEHVLPLDMRWPDAADAVLHYANGSRCVLDDFVPQQIALAEGQSIRLAPNGGRSSDGVLPFMNLGWRGGGVALAVGWSGQWQATYERDERGLRVHAGMEQTRLRLEPGERIRTPRILVVPWAGDDPEQGTNALRQVLLRHYCPRIDGELVIPPVAHMTMSTFHRTAWTDEANELDALAHAQVLGVEAFWVDACWYGEGGKWYEEVGSWTLRRDEFPRGLRPIGDAAHDAGMRFVLWAEPERVRKGTLIDREHAEFLIRLPDDGTLDTNEHPFFRAPENALFDLGNPQARQYMTEVLAGLIAEWGVDIYRQDFNFGPLPYWRAADAPDRQGITEIRYIEGLYQMWDDLRARFPRLAIDNCASGGRRIDLETTMRSFPLWRSDFSDVGGPEQGRLLHIGDQAQTSGLGRWVPLHAAAVWSFTPYAWRSAMSTGIVLYCDIRGDDFPVADAQAAIAELKRLRPFYEGDFHELLPFSLREDDWCAYQYHRPEHGDGFALFLRRHASTTASLTVELRGIDGAADYEVGFAPTFAEPVPERAAGATLARLPITVAEPEGSVLVTYRKVTP